ncbi:5597_t:CDS:2 [Cetraspora pellucida]|uniref:purine-nucleoside phosphorylase n=1 Tax=Cetraspora pellucida TaxID=1433469 RepID=A0A9N9IN72_9GLOM|nr:5597_t:CDS:2 [Cetraspora pellucida]
MPSQINSQDYTNWRPFWKKINKKKKKIHDQIYNADDASIKEFTVTANYLRARLPPGLSTPKVAIICGSGLGELADVIKDKVEFAYEDIPGFVSSTVQGHVGKLVFGLLGDKRTQTVCMLGRFHFYEGYTLKQITFPIRIFKMLGVEVLIVTNATGALSRDFKVGTIGVISDHISLPSLVGNNPLFGPNVSAFGTRFPPMSDAYDYNLRVIAFKAAKSLKFPEENLKEAIYTFYCGPSFETRAEARFLKLIGGDLLGMSTVPEVIVARHCGIRVLSLSLVTCMIAIGKGKCADPTEQISDDIKEPQVNHEEVLRIGKERTSDMQKLIGTIVDLIASI